MNEKIQRHELVEGRGVQLTRGQCLSLLAVVESDLGAVGVRKQVGRLQTTLNGLGVDLVKLQKAALEQMKIRGENPELPSNDLDNGVDFAMNSSDAGGEVYCAGVGYVQVPDVSLKAQILSFNKGRAMQLVVSTRASKENSSVAHVVNYHYPSGEVEQARWFVFRR